MGLALEVGILSDLKIHDQEGYNEVKIKFQNCYSILERYGVPSNFQEPEDLHENEIWSCQMLGYSGLHYLRRLAAHLWDRQMDILPGEEKLIDDDQIVEKYYNSYQFLEENPRKFSIFKKKPAPKVFSYEHLMVHSDAEGYYFPIDFKKVIVDVDSNIPGGMLGSTIRLKKELEKLAIWLELDLLMDIDSDEILNAPQSQGKGDHKWQKYGVESFSCIRLYRACEHSLQKKSAIVFC